MGSITMIAVIGFLVGLAAVALGTVIAILRGIINLLTNETSPPWVGMMIQRLLAGGGIIMLVSFGTCLATLNMGGIH